MNQQFILQFPSNLSYLQEDFVVCHANYEAFEAVTTLNQQAAGGFNRSLIIIGDDYSGKTHLAYIFASLSKAKFLNEEDFQKLTTAEILAIGNCFIIDDLQNLLAWEKNIFHLFNELSTKGGFLLITSNKKIGDLALSTKDLISRLLAVPSKNIDKPDPALIEALVFKFFSDRQIKIGHEVAKYFATRSTRDYGFIHNELEKIYKESLASKRKITIHSFKNI